METSLVKDNIFIFNNVGKEDVVEWSFEFKEKEDIQYISTGCYCTQAKSLEGNIFKGVLNIKNTGIEFKPGINEVTKVITVYFNDGQPHFIAGENKVMTANKEKKKETLTLRGTVKV